MLLGAGVACLEKRKDHPRPWLTAACAFHIMQANSTMCPLCYLLLSTLDHPAPLAWIEARVTCAPQLQLLLRAWRRVVTAPRPLTAAAAAAAAAAEEAPLTQEQWRDFKSKERKSQRAQRRLDECVALLREAKPTLHIVRNLYFQRGSLRLTGSLSVRAEGLLKVKVRDSVGARALTESKGKIW